MQKSDADTARRIISSVLAYASLPKVVPRGKRIVRRLAHENHVRFCLDNCGQALSKDGMIFNTQDAYLFGLGHHGAPR